MVWGDPFDNGVSSQRFRSPTSIAGSQRLFPGADDEAKFGVPLGPDQSVDDLIADILLAKNDQPPRFSRQQSFQAFYVAKKAYRQAQVSSHVDYRLRTA